MKCPKCRSIIELVYDKIYDDNKDHIKRVQRYEECCGQMQVEIAIKPPQSIDFILTNIEIKRSVE